MNGDISRIPIQSLGAVFSLTDILPDLPLPSALPLGLNSESFLSDPLLVIDANRCLCSKDESLVLNITETLSKVSVDHVDLDDAQNFGLFGTTSPPPLLMSILQQNASVFQPRPTVGTYPETQLNVFGNRWDNQPSANDTDPRHASFDETGGSPSKRKHKKKKRKKRRSEYTDPDASSGCDSNAATPSGSTDACPTTNNGDSPPTPYGVNVNVKPDEKKIILKFSLKRPVSRDQKSVDGSHKEKKDGKHRKSADHDRKHHHGREMREKPSSRESGSTIPMEDTVTPASNGVTMTAKPVLVASPNIGFSDQLNRKLPGPSTSLSPHTMIERFAALQSVKSPGMHHALDLHSVFDPDIAFPENFLKDLQPTAIMSSSQIETPSNPSALNYSGILPHDLLSVTDFSPNDHPVNQGGDGVYRGAFMIASHLEYDAKAPGNFLGHFNDNALSMSTPHKLFEPHAPQAIPMGLSSYFTSSHVQQPSNSTILKKKSAKPVPRRRGQVLKRRRCNEVDSLRTWTVKYPSNKGAERSDEPSAWDAAVDRQTNYLRNKRRRMTRQPTALAADYVLENDKDYPKPFARRSIVEDGDLDVSGFSGCPSDTHSGADDDYADEPNDETAGAAHPRNSSIRGGVLSTSGARCSYAGMDDDGEDVPEDECYKDAGGNSARRRRKADDYDAPFEIRLKEPTEQRFPHLQKAATEHARPLRERVRHKLPTAFSDTSTSDAALASSLKKFLAHIDSVLESVEDVDLLAGGADADGAPTDAIIPSSEIGELCRDAAKVKSTQVANQVPRDRLVKLLTLLLLNIRDGASVVRMPGDQESMERISRSVGASLIAINLMTAKEMPREIYLEDVIEQVVQVTRFQLSNSIYPEYDPAYRIENSAKGSGDPGFTGRSLEGSRMNASFLQVILKSYSHSFVDNQSSIRFRRARERETHKPSALVHLYYRLVEVVSGLAELINIQRLTDSLVLTLSSVGVSIFFVENISELQLAALKVVTGIFAQYPAYRQLIMEDIITSIARLPSSKKNLRSYRLNSEESIQMFTALSLLLVQSVIELPPTGLSMGAAAPLNSLKEPNKIDGGGGASSSAPQLEIKPEGEQQDTTAGPKYDDEVLVIKSYKTALITAHTFLSVFLRKSTTKGEDDYRIIFENFVNDLLLTVNKPEWPAAEVMLSLLGSLLVQQFNNKTLDQSIRVTSVDYLGTVASTLRRDAVTSQLKEHDIDLILRELTEGNQSDSEEDDEEEEDSAADKIEASEVDGEETSVKKEEGEVGDTAPKKVAVKKEANEESEGRATSKKIVNLTKMDRILVLRDAVLDYLLEDESDPVALYACKFYMGQWLEDCSTEADRAQKAAAMTLPEAAVVLSTSSKKNRRANRKTKTPSGDDSNDTEVQLTDVEIAEQRRVYLMDRLHDSPSCWRARCRPRVAGMLGAVVPHKVTQKLRVMFKGSIDYEDAYLICRYLASLRPFSQSFDVYLSQICKLLSESSVAVRTKALRCLSAVVEADPGVLARSDIELAVRSRLMDTSTSVREAAVDLLGRFLVCRPELTTQYYPMLSDRIRDKGVSVRKRVIRILRDVCLEQPDFPRIAEICVKIIRRVNDEESVKKLVSEVFQTLWFTPVREKESVKLLHKVMNITDVVVSASKDTGIEWLEQFLESLLTKEESEKVRPAEKACVQIVECLVQNIIRLEEIPGQTKRLVACLATLHLFTKIRPHLAVKHAMLLQPYLSAQGNTANATSLDSLILHYVARILEVTIPLVEHPSETFLAQLEEDLVRLTLRQGKMVLESCVACLGAVVNKVSKNYALARGCFQGFFNALVKFKEECQEAAENGESITLTPKLRPTILRSLFTVGLLCKHFDAKVFSLDLESKILAQVFDTLMFFSEQITSDLDVRKKAISGLGFLCTRHHELLWGTQLCKFYHDLLQAPVVTSTPNSPSSDYRASSANMELKSLVLENLLSFFLEEEKRMVDQDAKWKATHKEESLKIMGDVASGTGSYVAQAYLKEVMETFFSPSEPVRLTALSVVTTILRQGLIHPVQTVPYLIAMQTDSDASIRVKAEAQLQEIENKFPGFITMRAIQGVCFSYRLQCVLGTNSQQRPNPSSDAHNTTASSTATTTPQATPQKRVRSSRNAPQPIAVDSANESGGTEVANDNLATATAFAEAIRGARDVNSDVPGALNSQLYSMLRGNRAMRRSFLNGLLNLFDDSQHLYLGRLLYVADNLAFFPYQCQAEPLFVVHHIDLLVSMNGSTLLQAVREALFPELKENQVSAAMMPPPAPQQQQHPMVFHHGEEEAARLAAARECLFKSPSAAEFIEVHGSIQVGLASVAAGGGSTVSNPLLARLEAEEESEEYMVGRILAAGNSHSGGLSTIRETIRASQACLLLLNLKQYLKEVYGITDSKLQKYSPSDSCKLWEKQLTRKSGVRFVPVRCLRSAIEERRSQQGDFDATTTASSAIDDAAPITEEAARELVQEFFEFRKLILSIDPPDDDDLDTSLNATAIPEAAGCSDDRGFGNAAVSVASVALVADMPLRLPAGRSLVPQSHNRSSDEEDDSADSDVGGASRLLLAQSAPQRRRAGHSTAGGSATGGASTSRGGSRVPSGTSRRKSARQPRIRSVYISSEDSESEAVTASSEEESS